MRARALSIRRPVGQAALEYTCYYRCVLTMFAATCGSSFGGKCTGRRALDDIYICDRAHRVKAMKPRYLTMLALVGWSFWIPSIRKTIPKDCPSCAASLVAQNSSQSADSQDAVDTQAAEDVRQRHLPEMLKIPHVVNMGIEFKDSEIIFNVQVDKEANVPQVERMVPSKIEGYDVVVEPVPTGVLWYGYHSFIKPASPPDGQ
jgi:hypothetical protein